MAAEYEDKKKRRDEDYDDEEMWWFEATAVVPPSTRILQENGDGLLLETDPGGFILMES